MATAKGKATRAPLARSTVLAAAVELADLKGVDALTMRSLAQRLGVEAMSLYHHVRNKEDLLDGMVDLVFAEMYLPVIGADWTGEMRARSTSGRAVLRQHRWAVGLMDSRRNPGRETLRHHDSVLGCLRAAGFSVPMAAHAFALLDAHLYGFMVQELSLPFDGPGAEVTDLVSEMLGSLEAGDLPHLAEMAAEHVMLPGYDFGDEFAYGLDLILDGLAQRVRAPRSRRSPARTRG